MKYDVIVIGAGSAGCVVAARLAEGPRRSVLLLEAGVDYPDFERLPNDLKYGYTNAAYRKGAPHDWEYTGMANSQQQEPMPVPRARVMGGCSAHNGPWPMFWRGAPEDFDDWASRGNDQWSYARVLPYFRKMEGDLDTQDDFHGTDGPIPVLQHKRSTWLPFQEASYRAAVDAGFPEFPEVNHPEFTGVAPRTENNIDGVRISMAMSYIDPNRHRLNLTIRPNVLATRILFDGKRAIGVEVESGGERFTLEGEEIILSAGPIASPQLLMLSGVGPADHLRSLGVQVAHDLPGVGQNMRDHPAVGVVASVKQGFPQDPDAPRLQICIAYTARGSSARNDMTLTPVSFASDIRWGGNPMQSIDVGIYVQLFLPTGAGNLRLTSSDPHAPPHLDYRYLEDPWDRRRMREGVRMGVQLLKHPAYRDIIAERIAPTDEDMASDETLDAWMLKNVGTSYHNSGTCKMGPASDSMAVVDQHCRVHGLERLRVVDASVMPDVVRATINATVIMIGERATDLIKEQLE